MLLIELPVRNRPMMASVIERGIVRKMTVDERTLPRNNSTIRPARHAPRISSRSSEDSACRT
jgi:hypothetical protein